MLATTKKPALKLVLLPTVLAASLLLAACQKDASPTENGVSNTNETEVATGLGENENADTATSATADSSETSKLTAEEQLGTELSRHRWKLLSATDAAKKPVSALMNIKDQVTLSFNQYQGQDTLSYSVGCNTISAAYQLKSQTLTTEDGMSTKMSCGELDSAESQLNTLMQGSSQLQITTGENPTLTQVTGDAVTLIWRGRLTSQAKYNSKGETVFWAVSAKKVPCEVNGSKQCLQVKPITYNDQGIKTSEGDWAPFIGEIDGYQHDGAHEEVLRLQRFQLDSSEVSADSTEDEQYAYLLDAVIESAVAE